MTADRVTAPSWLLLLVSILLLGCACSRAATAADAAQPPGPPPDDLAAKVKLELVVKGLSSPVALVAAPGDRERLFVVEKTGKIRILRGQKLDAAPFLDIGRRISNDNEQGLLGLAFHPRFADNRRLYINFTDENGDTRVVELKADAADPDRADMESERELLYVDQPYSNHNGGHVAFGPDGLLYVGLGDGGSRNDPKKTAQNPKSRLGKMLQIDVDAASVVVRTVASGLRNPWRYSFDRKTGDLYIGDVGQDKYEEVHVVPGGKLNGQNFGWSIVEGNGHCVKKKTCKTKGLVPPVLEYTHSDGCSITGGVVYRGKAIPELDGAYFYADFCMSWLRSFRHSGKRITDSWDWGKALNPKSRVAQMASFGEDWDGEMYVVSFDGKIWKLVRK